jgi:ubiquinone/menaquinone biosynthesis C-methylase UbiE
MVQPVKFWDKVADRYAKRPIADEASYQQKLKVTREYFRPNMEVLEFGCGTGSTAILHAPYVKHIHATDLSARMLEIARSKATAQHVENVSFEQSSIKDIQVADASYDAVLGLSVLHLLEDKEDAIAKVHRILKPGGVFVSSTVCLGDFMKLFRYVAPIGRFFGVIPFVRVFTASELKTSLQDAGFVIDHYWQPGKNKAVFIVAKKAR